MFSVLLNSVMGNYISTISSIDDALEDLEEELLTITEGYDIGIQIQALRRQYMLMKKAILPLKEQYVKLLRAENLLIHKVNRAFFQRCERSSPVCTANYRNLPGNAFVIGRPLYFQQ